MRKEIAEDSTLAQEVVESLNQPILALTKRFRAMKLKDEPIQSGVAATAEAIQGTFDRVHFIDPSLECDKLSADTLRKSQPLSKFLKKHCQTSHYCFQLKKCGSSECYYCLQYPIRLPEPVFLVYHGSPYPYLTPQETITGLLTMFMVSLCLKKTDPHSKVMEKTRRLSQRTFPTKTFQCTESQRHHHMLEMLQASCGLRQRQTHITRKECLNCSRRFSCVHLWEHFVLIFIRLYEIFGGTTKCSVYVSN